MDSQRSFRLISRLSWAVGLGLVLIPVGLSYAEDEAPSSGSPRFSCVLDNGRYTVMYSPESQAGQQYPWAVPDDMGAAWPAERRCNVISDRLESYRPDGLVELQTGLENGYNTVCVTTEAVSSCRIVFTVPPGQDPVATRDRVFNNLVLADQGSSTEGVNTFTDGESSILDQIGDVLGGASLPGRSNSSRSGINLRPFLDPADGGTGAQFTGGNGGGQPLNPDNFR
ncbi:MAG: COP23 domain-containing protein [Cyanobacteria bacterium]|nr:COP23 domain-containing protein [Cyanobacteriota bacterium]MDA0866666.1 COP23 domain-containing protein [Cyanobacteriota bacterium]